MSDGRGELRRTLWELECEYWNDVDTNDAFRAPDFYMHDAVFDIGLGDAPLSGRREIEGFYARRRDAGERTSAHIVQNFVVESLGDGVARTQSVIVLYAGEGVAPLPTTTPGLIARCTVDLKQDGTSWLITARRSVPLFVSDGQPTFADSDEGR